MMQTPTNVACIIWQIPYPALLGRLRDAGEFGGRLKPNHQSNQANEHKSNCNRACDHNSAEPMTNHKVYKINLLKSSSLATSSSRSFTYPALISTRPMPMSGASKESSSSMRSRIV